MEVLQGRGSSDLDLETTYKGKIRRGVGDRARGMAEASSKDGKYPSREAFIFPGRFGGFMDSINFRHRVLHKLAEELELPKPTFQVIRRTIATLARRRAR